MIRKFNLYKLSDQVKYILYTHGLENIFNYTDYKEFKQRFSTNTIDRAYKIVDLFIEYNNCAMSDFEEYVF